MLSPLEQSIFKTLHYFALREMPLTPEEVFYYLWQPPKDTTLGVVEDSLERLAAAGQLSHKNGFYFLNGREADFDRRRRAVVPSDQKLKRARSAARWIAAVPFIRAILVGNSVAAGTASDDSDIDFVIIAEGGRIWIVRFFTNLILRLLGRRRFGDKVKNRICLSFFVDTKHLNLAPWRVASDDPHAAYWLHQLTSLYDPFGYHERFVDMNTWTKQYIPNCQTELEIATPPLKNTSFGRRWKEMWEKMWQGSYGDMIENQMRGVQEALNWPLLKSGDTKPEGVLIAPGFLRLYGSDLPRQLWNEWKAATQTINQK